MIKRLASPQSQRGLASPLKQGIYNLLRTGVSREGVLLFCNGCVGFVILLSHFSLELDFSPKDMGREMVPKTVPGTENRLKDVKTSVPRRGKFEVLINTNITHCQGLHYTVL